MNNPNSPAYWEGLSTERSIVTRNITEVHPVHARERLAELAGGDVVEEHVVVLHEVARDEEHGVRVRPLDGLRDRELALVVAQPEAEEQSVHHLLDRVPVVDVDTREDESDAG